MFSKRSVLLCGTMLLGPGPEPALGAEATPAAKQAFLERGSVYLWIEITETGTREVGADTPQDALTDEAHRFSRKVKFEVPLTKPMPGMVPASSMSLSPEELSEPNRFAAWMAAPPDDQAIEPMTTSGKVDRSSNPMFVPVEFSIDDVTLFRYRDTPTTSFATETTLSTGRGLAYTARSGTLTCDLETMLCDVRFSTEYSDGTDLVTIRKTSDVPNYEAPPPETVGPYLLLPTVSRDLAKRLTGFPLTLPEPSTLTFSGPSSGPTAQLGTTVTVKVTLSAKSAGSR